MSTNRRVLKRNMSNSLTSSAVPPLATAYVNAVESVCGRRPWLHGKYGSMFKKRQRQLSKLGVSIDEFASAVVKVWWPWCKDRNMKVVPVGLFVGDKAWSRFKDMVEQTYVSIDDNRLDELSDVIAYEHQCALLYIGSRGAYTWKSIHGMCKHLLPESYGGVISSVVKLMAMDHVLAMLGELYGVPDAETYDDIMDALP